VTIENGVGFITSKQRNLPLLCGSCEQAIGVWDNYAARVANTDGAVTPLLAPLLDPASSKALTADRRIGEVAPFDAGLLGRFGLSVVWRRHVADDRTGRRGDLGPYGDLIRAFLTDDAQLSERIAVRLLVADIRQEEDQAFRDVITFPVCSRSTRCRVHAFALFGLVFLVATGGQIPPGERRCCLIRGDGLMELARPRDLGMLQLAAESIQGARVVASARRRIDRATRRRGSK
jgi:hypothetical protein